MWLLQTRVPLVDEILETHQQAIGQDMVGYRNHVYRVLNLCLALAPNQPDRLDKIAMAAVFHDLGIWTDRTFDYLAPSAALAGRYLETTGRIEWAPEIAAMILEHHKISAYRDNPAWLVEPFRRADWIDVSMGVMTGGLGRNVIRGILDYWPSAGFHRRLVGLTLDRLRDHPLSPLPMLRR
jgi:hypothetical protein